MLQILTLAIALAACSATKIHYNDCSSGSNAVTLNEINFLSCSAEPCTAQPGGDYNIRVNFTANNLISAGKTQINAKVLGLSFPIPLPTNDICAVISCPVQSGQTVVFDYTIPIPSFAPQLTVTAEWKVTDQNSNEIVCITTQISIHS